MALQDKILTENRPFSRLTFPGLYSLDELLLSIEAETNATKCLKTACAIAVLLQGLEGPLVSTAGKTDDYTEGLKPDQLIPR